MKELMIFEETTVEILADEKGNLLFELYSTGMTLGYVNNRKNSTGKMYTTSYKARINKVLK